jgi:uncharacterized protein
MENNLWNISGQQTGNPTATIAKSFLPKVFGWMFFALSITAIISMWFASDASLISLLIKAEGGLSLLGWVVMLAPIGFVMLMSFTFNKLSFSTLLILFTVYSVLMGMSLSFIFLVYTAGSIATTFAIAAAMFGAMALTGYYTKTDLTSFGSIMYMGLIGIIIASLVNFFMKSDMLYYIISYVGVAVFTGLTAYDVQRLKRLGQEAAMDETTANKMAVMGALNLYLDFINLFLMLLRLFGDRR